MGGTVCIGILVMWCFAGDVPAAPSGATFCQIAKPFYWSSGDTRMSKEQADTHNRKGKKLCGWKKT